MASHGKSYPDRSRDNRRRPFKGYGVAEERMQSPTLTPEQERAYMDSAAFDAMMREAPGTGPIGQLGDYMLDRDKK